MNDRITVQIELSQGNLNNAHFYLRDHLDLFPGEVIGPANQRDGLGRTVAVTYAGDDEPCETDIAGPQRRSFAAEVPSEPSSTGISSPQGTAST